MNAAQDLVGGRYRLLEVIGAGGMGRVWLADDELLRRRVAVKEIGTPTDVSTSELLDLQLTTMREARATARLDHPGVVGVFDVVWRPDRSWIVMEYVESRSLQDVVRENGPLPHREVARIGLNVLGALRVAHAAGVLHRDVKPHNVLLATDGRVVLTDFGLAKLEGIDQGPEPLLGSPHFVAPERLSGVESSPASDLWSFGAMLYAAVEGRAPFQRGTATASLTALTKQERPDGAQHPGPLTPIIDGLLVKDPAKRMTAEDAEDRLRRVADRAVGVFPMHIPRPGTAAAIASALGRSIPARPARRRIARSTKIALLAAAVLLVGTTGTALALDVRPGSFPGTTPSADAVSAMAAVCAAGGQAVSGTTDNRGYAVPAGWLWHSDPNGFDVAVPQGWTRSQDGTTACFRDPGGSRSFRVDATARLTGTALAYWQDQEQTALTERSLPGYTRVAMTTLTQKQGGADWEFTWQPPGEPVRRHERRVLLSMAPDRTYLVQWTTRDQDWTSNEAYLELILASLS
ncbi:serine/threonine-protein kinase [Actinoplanes friuliensis]|uniref:non-specific serine/threonine protein kinase n=1 Tax=Actinoplanes friuliensis DSM 7358 TaxID=1246995 RepID=U5VP73_9ACTN|nr:serine/threonine-protein kinase [Actinoplanes friuliensis]AGZ38768.1 Serine/threonine protein kinase [Actinoplanes friuliensis DSM 7358]